MCWFGEVSQRDKNNLQRVVNISSKIIGLTQSTLNALYEKQVLRKANTIINDNIHILHNEYVLLPSSSSISSHIKQIGSVIHLFQCMHDFSTTSTSDVSVNTSVIVCVCCILFILFLFMKGRPQL